MHRIALTVVPAAALACGSDGGGSSTVAGDPPEMDFFAGQPADPTSSGFPDTQGTPQPSEAPANFLPADRGGWALGGEIPDDADLDTVPDEGRQDGCGSILTGVIRDFSVDHPDFGGDISGLQRGLVRPTLGANGKPVLSDDFEDGLIQSPQSFSQWYETVAGVNRAFYLALSLAPTGDTFGFASSDFFPLDGAGFGNEDEDRNFYFTFELHTQFRYAGGEVFRFSGDDDLWVFINGRLAIDLGGVHEEEDETIDLDAAAERLGIQPGNEYALDFFQAERHVTESNFQIETTLDFTSCGVVLR